MQIFIKVIKKTLAGCRANDVSVATDGPSSQAGRQHCKAIRQHPGSPSDTSHTFSTPLWGRIREALMTACSLAA